MSEEIGNEDASAPENALDITDRIEWHGHELQLMLFALEGEKTVSMVTYKNTAYRDWVEISEACAIVEKWFHYAPCHDTILKWCRAGKINAQQSPVGNRWIIETISLLSFIDPDFAAKINRKKAS